MELSMSSFMQWKFNIALCRTIGWKWAFRYLQILGKLYFFFRKREKKIICNSVGTVFASAHPPMKISRTCREVFSGIITHYYEKLFNVYATEETSRLFFMTHVKDDGLSVVREALGEGKGVLLVTGHFGGVEFIPGYLGSNNLPVSIVVRFATDHLRQLSMSKGKNFRIEIIDPDRSDNVFFSICKHLRQNRVVITQCDEIDEWRPSPGRRTSFLGKATALDRTLTLLVHRARCPVVFALMHRSFPSGYRFSARPFKEVSPDSSGAPSRPVGEIGLKYVEGFIYKYPAEWYLWKKFPIIGASLRPSETGQVEAGQPVRLQGIASGSCGFIPQSGISDSDTSPFLERWRPSCLS